jgi:hypothetical protein
VRQHENVILAIYALNNQLYPDFTHLWFPTPWMDEFVQKGSWLAGRVGNGYIAVATPGGFSPLKSGDTAHQEWQPNGNGALYVSVLGDKKSYTDFKSFVRKLNEPTFDEKNLTISWKHKRRFDLNWEGPFLVDGVSEQLEGGLPEMAPRLDNPAVALESSDSIFDAEFGKEKLRIDVVNGKRLHPKSQV